MILSLYSSVSFKNPFGLAHTVRIAKKLGYQAIDVRGYSLDSPLIGTRNINAVGYDMLGPHTLDSTGTKELKELLKAEGMPISGISCYNPLTLPEGKMAEASYDRFLQMLDFAEMMSIPAIRLIGYSEKPAEAISLPRETAFRLYCGRLKELCKAAAPKGIRVLLENGENCIPSTAKEMLAIKEAVGEENLDIVFDVLNFAFEGLDPYQELAVIKPYVKVLHVKNAIFSTDTKDKYAPKSTRGFRWSLLSQGNIDFSRIFSELPSATFSGTIVCEYANPYKGMERDFWNTAPDAYEWAKDAKDYIQTFRWD